MDTTTQISGNIRPNNRAYLALLRTLTQLGILTTHSLQYESFLLQDWHRYNDEVAFYESIARSSFHIIYNDKEIDDNVGTQTLYAMLKNRPIVMTGAPIFSQQLHPFISEVIAKHFRDFHSIKLPELELTELQELFAKLKTTHYKLTKNEYVLIRALVKAHFRNIAANPR